MPFAEDDYAFFELSMLVPYQLDPTDGGVFPLYNVYEMMAMAKNTLVVNSGVSGSGATSLSPIATKDDSGVALMLTNTAGTSNVTVNMNNLPGVFQGGPFQFKEYLVDATHSNWAYNHGTATLQLIANTMQSKAGSFSTTLNMAQDSVALIVLTPGNGGGGPVPAAPTRLTAMAANGQIALTWTTSPGASNYSIYRGTSSGNESGTPVALGVAPASYTDNGLSNGTVYYYKVAAINLSGTSGYSNEASATPKRVEGGNLIQNPGFESGALSPWIVEGAPTGSGVDDVPAHAHSGGNSGYIFDNTHTGTLIKLTQTVTVRANTNYTLTGWVAAQATTNGLFGVSTTSETAMAATAISNTFSGTSSSAAYDQYTVTFNSGSNTSVVVFGSYTTSSTQSSINLDDVSLVVAAVLR
jgi:hypothetical protein